MITVAYRWQTAASSELRGAFDRAAETWESALDIDIVESEGAADWLLRDDATYGPGAAMIGGPTMWVDGAIGETHGGWQDGTYSQMVLVHEIGHLLGLEHPHDYGDPATMATSAMSYTYVHASSGAVLYPEKPGVKDIADLAGRYGLNMASAGDGTTWRVDRPDQIETVYDVGGARDVLDLSDILTGCTVDLGAGLVDTYHGFVVMDGIERVRLSGGRDVVMLSEGDVIMGLERGDVLLAEDNHVARMSRGDKKELGVTGRYWEIDGAAVEWGGGKKALAAMLAEDVG